MSHILSEAAGTIFEETLDFFSGESMIEWSMEKSAKELDHLSGIFKKVRLERTN